MPTTKPRHAVTETDTVSAALVVAARRWPEDAEKPARLLAHLIEAGREHVEPQIEANLAARRARIDRLAGCMSGVYSGPEAIAIEDLHAEWPE